MLRQLGDLLDQVDRADDQAHLGVLVLLAAVVVHADEALEAHVLLVRVGDARCSRPIQVMPLVK